MSMKKKWNLFGRVILAFGVSGAVFGDSPGFALEAEEIQVNHSRASRGGWFTQNLSMLPMSEKVADTLAALKSGRQYNCKAKFYPSGSPLGGAATLAVVFELDSCRPLDAKLETNDN